MLAVQSLKFIALASLVAGATIHHSHHSHKRGVTCEFPNYTNMVAVYNTEDSPSEGWAQDGPCEAGSYCQYACEPGYLMGQWNPAVTSYTYPGSQQGGLWCNSEGVLSKPISNHDYCYYGKGTAQAVNTANENVAFCQTVLPGDESMLIPTNVLGGDTSPLSVAGTDYWASTASHFYINPPGVSVDEGCRWGSQANPYGNWAPYVAGFNMDDEGNTYSKIGWNPIYVDSGSPFVNENPNFGIRLKCDDESKCNGGTCEINPSTYGYNKVSNNQQADSNGAAWCVVTSTGNTGVSIEVFTV